MRYPQGGGLTAERQAFRERVRMEAVAMFADGRGSTEIAKELRVSARSVQRWRLHDSWRAEPGRVLREAQRLITTNHVRGAILEVRRTLEWIQQNAGWDKPGPRKDPRQCTQKPYLNRT
ncbi:helix-turn-helix domain-containing protein [Streptomyces sp. NPDC093093]|uniref:helix-turn-helix domain-containing protein n=1 Tax=Streptomyces sp. NPDC093093 TaxID=3366025 RepID=UPI00382806C7